MVVPFPPVLFRGFGLVLTCVMAIAAFWATAQQARGPSRGGARNHSVPTGLLRDKGTVEPASTITVNSTSDVANGTDGLCTLREAITAANSNSASGAIAGECAAGSNSGSDTIDFQAGLTGSITLTSALLPDLSSSMTINGPGASQLTVSGNNGARVFNVIVASPGVVTISGLTIANGKAQNGGGIYNNGTVNVTGTTFSFNLASGDGGGIFNDNNGTATVTNSTFDNGQGNGHGGGGIANNGTATVTNCTFTNNVGMDGGGIYNLAGIVTLLNSSLSTNFAFSRGPGIYNDTGTINIINSTINSNRSPTRGGDGGGIYNRAGTLTLTNSTVSGNISTFGGGGIINLGGTLALTNSTVSGNSGGIINSSGTANIKNSIFANNGADLSGTFNSQDYNLIGNTAGATFTGTTTHNIFNVNALLGPLDNNGGPTQTHSLLAGSPALDAGDNCVFDNSCTPALAAAITTDQRGFARKVDGPDADTTDTVDIGAFEVQVFLEDITNKATNEDTQLQFTFNVGGGANITSVTATSSNTMLVPNNAGNIAVSGSGSTRTLSINPAVNLSGTSTITVTVNGNNNQSMTDTFELTVNAVNDAPSFTKGVDQTVNGDAGTQTVPNWATSISAGPAESGQTLTFNLTNNTNPGLFSAGPAISSTGTLSYTPLSTASGTATITINLKDNGGTANGGVDTSPSQTFTITVIPPKGGIIGFAAASSNTTENSGSTDVMVNRTGNTSSVVTVDYTTNDHNGLPCSSASGVASPKCDFTTASGTLSFAAGQTSKTITVLISQDSFVEGPEVITLTLSNQTGGAALGAQSNTAVTIADDVTEPPTNPIDDARNFVRQQYNDFLNREPDQSGWDFWTNQITSCGSDSQCIEVRRINVSAAFFLSIEFQETGYLVERFYKVGYGDATGTSQFQFNHQVPVPMVRFNEFLKDTQRIGRGVVVSQPGWEQTLENNTLAYALEFVQTSRLIAALPTTLSPDQFVDRLNQNTGGVLILSERATVINLFGGAANTTSVTARAQAVRMVADDTDLYNAEFNRAFVLAEYFGYLRRNPNDAPETTMDYTGYDFWVTKLNQFNGNYINSEMVKAFLSSSEYRQRFGP